VEPTVVSIPLYQYGEGRRAWRMAESRDAGSSEAVGSCGQCLKWSSSGDMRKPQSVASGFT